MIWCIDILPSLHSTFWSLHGFHPCVRASIIPTFMCPSIQPCIHLLLYSFVRPTTHPSNLFMHLFICSFVPPSVSLSALCIQPPVHPYIRDTSILPCIYVFIVYPSVSPFHLPSFHALTHGEVIHHGYSLMRFVALLF